MHIQMEDPGSIPSPFPSPQGLFTQSLQTREHFQNRVTCTAKGLSTEGKWLLQELHENPDRAIFLLFVLTLLTKIEPLGARYDQAQSTLLAMFVDLMMLEMTGPCQRQASAIEESVKSQSSPAKIVALC